VLTAPKYALNADTQQDAENKDNSFKLFLIRRNICMGISVLKILYNMSLSNESWPFLKAKNY
jgi:hypothetical protein